jgi:hypothetical protein
MFALPIVNITLLEGLAQVIKAKTNKGIKGQPSASNGPAPT